VTWAESAQIASGICAAIGLTFVGWQLWRTRQARALEALQKFIEEMNRREAALRDATDKRHALIEFLNFLEVYAAASRTRLVSGVAREFIDDKLIDSIVILQQSAHWHETIADSINSEIVYKYLRTFTKKQAPLIASRGRVADQHSLVMKQE
jgi:hypothetical protein